VVITLLRSAIEGRTAMSYWDEPADRWYDDEDEARDVEAEIRARSEFDGDWAQADDRMGIDERLFDCGA